MCAARLRPVALAAATALPRRQQRRRCRPAARAHPCHRARRPNARVRRAARAVAVERAPRCRSSPRASKRGAPFAAGVAGGARCDASQAEPRRRRGRSRSLTPAGAAVATDPDAVMAALAAGTHAAVRAPATPRAMRRPLGESDECPSWGCGGASGAQRGTSAPGRSSRSSRAAESDRGRRGGPAWWSPATMSGLARGRIRRPRGAVPGAPTADLARRVPRAGCVWAGGVLCSVTFRPQTPARRCRSCERSQGSRPHILAGASRPEGYEAFHTPRGCIEIGSPRPFMKQKG